MSTPKHTPGPWEAIVRHDPFKGCHYIDTDIGMIHPRWDEKRVTIDANARLIAAAPELLEACRAMDRADAYIHERGTTLALIRAAIAKATGVQS